MTAPPPYTAGSATGGVRTTLRLEGALVLLGCVLAYAQVGNGWGWFAGGFFLPDLSFLAAAGGPRLGARAYNVAHSYALPLLLATVTLQGYGVSWGVWAALIWAAHIGFDRMLGYGLKYDTGFSDTHLGRIGRIGLGRDSAEPSADR